MKPTRIITIMLITIGFILTFNSVNHNKQLQQIKAIKLQDTQLKLRVLQSDYEKAIKDKTTTEEQYKVLEQQKQDLEKQLQAKKASNTVYASAPIQSDDYYVNWIIQHESSGNPNNVNGGSGACGLFQRLPCPWSYATDPDWVGASVAEQMADGLSYINHRYGSPHNAYLFWISHGWY